MQPKGSAISRIEIRIIFGQTGPVPAAPAPASPARSRRKGNPRCLRCGHPRNLHTVALSECRAPGCNESGGIPSLCSAYLGSDA